MKAKLTLYWEDDFKEKAIAFAKSKGMSLSALVEESLFDLINEKRESKEK